MRIAEISSLNVYASPSTRPAERTAPTETSQAGRMDNASLQQALREAALSAQNTKEQGVGSHLNVYA